MSISQKIIKEANAWRSYAKQRAPEMHRPAENNLIFELILKLMLEIMDLFMYKQVKALLDSSIIRMCSLLSDFNSRIKHSAAHGIYS
jgi:hypothetical protein